MLIDRILTRQFAPPTLSISFKSFNQRKKFSFTKNIFMNIKQGFSFKQFFIHRRIKKTKNWRSKLLSKNEIKIPFHIQHQSHNLWVRNEYEEKKAAAKKHPWFQFFYINEHHQWSNRKSWSLKFINRLMSIQWRGETSQPTQ